MIGEIILYSMGYTDAKAMAVKIVTTYKRSEQLSPKVHYDYGMRAVIAVLRASGNLKSSEGHLPEDILVLRAIIDVNAPKFLAPDVPLFNGITQICFLGWFAGAGPEGHAINVWRVVCGAESAAHRLLLGQDRANLRHDGRAVRSRRFERCLRLVSHTR